MTRTCRVLVLSAAALVGLAGQPAPAAAGKRIAVLEIEGARSDALRKQVASVVSRRHRVLSPRQYHRAARKAHATRLRPIDVRRVAALLDADGIVEGMLVAEDRGYVLRLRLREGKTGRTVRKFTVFLREPRMPKKIRAQLADKMYAAIRGLSPLADDVADDGAGFDERGDDRDDRRARRRDRARASRRARDVFADDRDIAAVRRDRGDRDGEEWDDRDGRGDDEWDDRDDRARRRRGRTAARRRGRRAVAERARSDDRDEDVRADRRDDDADDAWDDDDADDAWDDGGDDDEFDDRAGRRRDDEWDDRDRAPDDDRQPRRHRRGVTARTAAVSLHVGASAIGRSLLFTYRPDLMDQAPSQYKGAFAPGVVVSGAVYPLAAGDGDGAGKNLGVLFDIERSIGLSSQIADAEMNPVKLPTQRQRWGVHVAYRHNFGSKDTHPSLIASVGYNKLSFTIDKTNVPDGVVVDVPDVAYTYVDPGLALRLPLSRRIALAAEGKFMAIVKAGQIVEPDQYGKSKVTGVSGDVAVEVQAAAHWLVRLGGTVTAVGYAFQPGAGKLSSGRDGDLNSLDVGGAMDRYLGGYVTLGYLY